MDLSLIILQETINQPIITNNVISIMSNFRIMLEKGGSGGSYKYLKLYADWVAHDKIDKSFKAFEVLEQLTDSMIAHNTKTDESKWIGDAVIEGFGLHILQTEILDFGKRLGLNVDKYRDIEAWHSFLELLTTVLVNKPLAFPEKLEKRDKAIYKRIYDKATRAGSLKNAVISVSFEIIEGSIWWNIKTLESKIGIIGPMATITQNMVDNYSNITPH